jgi:hypothetical protein
MKIFAFALCVAAVSATHYEDPKGGCGSDEQAVQVTGVDGAFCSPACTGTTCPSDVPTGVTATPQCVLQSATGTQKNCGLICNPSGNDDQCGANASCKSIQGVGLCTYDDDASATTLEFGNDIDEDLSRFAADEAKFARWAQLFPGKQATKEAFLANDKIIAEHNAQNGTDYTLGHNEFSGLTADEFKAIYLSSPMPAREARDFAEVSEEIAGSIDWTTKGAVTPVKNQAQCGSCWAFSTTGGMEGAYYVANNKLVSFSEQQLVSCDKNGDQGCNGGLMDNAFAWIKKNGGLCTEADYKYTSGGGSSGTCKKTCSPVKGSTPKKVTDVKASDSALMSALGGNPVSVAVDAEGSAWQLYKSGVYTGKCGSQLDHGVLAVGYGTDGSNDYYKVKNSWGASWGEKGFIRLGRGSSYKSGQCGILTGPPSYPTL